MVYLTVFWHRDLNYVAICTYSDNGTGRDNIYTVVVVSVFEYNTWIRSSVGSFENLVRIAGYHIMIAFNQPQQRQQQKTKWK